MSEIPLHIMRLPHGADLPLPAYQTADAAGLDLMAAVDAPLELAPGATAMVPTGLIIAVPP
ncbi:MAG: dUTP diphosphatase, partial [Pseudolabrys sp.]